DMPCDLAFAGLAEKGRVVGRSDVDQSIADDPGRKMQGNDLAQIAVLFALIEMIEYFRGDQVGHPGTDFAGGFDQGCHASWRLWRAAMIVRTLPEAPRPAVYARRLLLQERKIRLPYQRTIAEQPDPVLAFKTIQALVGIEGIAGHGDGSGRGAFMRHDSGRLQRGSG